MSCLPLQYIRALILRLYFYSPLILIIPLLNERQLSLAVASQLCYLCMHCSPLILQMTESLHQQRQSPQQEVFLGHLQ